MTYIISFQRHTLAGGNSAVGAFHGEFPLWRSADPSSAMLKYGSQAVAKKDTRHTKGFSWC